MKVLCVAEKPSIAKSITQILSGGQYTSRDGKHKYTRNFDFPYKLPPPHGPRNGDSEFTVTSVLGHLTASDFDDEYRRWGSCDPFALFDAPIVTYIASSLKLLEKNLQTEARHANLLMIWTDCDREGEHIGSEIAATCRKVNPGIVVKRARFSAIIANQIHQACRQANELDMRQADAVDARIALDLRIGAAFTRFMTRTLQSRLPELENMTISYGPCQFPTLGFVVDQYKRVQSFVPETFWHIYVSIIREGDDGEEHEVSFTWRRGHLFDLSVAMLLYEQCVERPLATVTKVETSPTSKWKPLPLTTVNLQQSGSRLLGMSPKRVLDIAEKLYQKGFLSYPRTETDQFDKAFDFEALIRKQTHDNTWGEYAQKLLDGAFERPRNGNKNDQAHPPIHPTAAANNLDADERRVYEYVTRRFLGSCSTNAIGKQTSVEIEVAGEFFSTSGLVVLQRNYLEIFTYDTWSTHELPDFEQGEQFMPSVCELKDGSTSAPSLLTEADLVGLMDRNGIGTDATIAEHIAKIIEREYVIQQKQGKYLVPSMLGIGLVEGFDAIGFDRSLSKPHLRRETEHRMKLICDGNTQKNDVLDATIHDYKEVYVKARREFHSVINSVINYLRGDGEEQEAVRAAARGGRGRGAGRGARGGRGGRGGGNGGNNRNDDDDDDDDDDDNDNNGTAPSSGRGARGGRESRGARGSRGGSSTRGTSTSRARVGNDPAPKRPRKRKSDADAGQATDQTRQCSCGDNAVLRKSGANTKNPGRQFYKCPKPQSEQCDYFEWADEPSRNGGGGGGAGAGRGRATGGGANSSSRVTEPPPPKRARQPGPSGKRRCECGLEARSSTVSKDGPNKGRSFWACPSGPRARCEYFEWNEDGEGGGGDNSGGGASGSGGGGAGDCFKCGQSGHWSRDCPNEYASSRRSAVSGRGGDRQEAPTNSRGATSGDCFKCGQTGHWSKDCPNDSANTRRGPTSGSSSNRGGSSSQACFQCGQEGHWAGSCPNR